MKLFLEPNQATFAVARLQEDESLWVAPSALLSVEGAILQEDPPEAAPLRRLFTKEAMSEVTLAPPLPGVVCAIKLEDERFWVKASSLLCAAPTLTLKSAHRAINPESFFIVEGFGELLVSGFGALWQMNISQGDSVALEHLVAFNDSIEYSLRRIGGFTAKLLGSEQLVCEFKGQGRAFVQARSPKEFGERLRSPGLKSRAG